MSKATASDAVVADNAAGNDEPAPAAVDSVKVGDAEVSVDEGAPEADGSVVYKVTVSNSVHKVVLEVEAAVGSGLQRVEAQAKRLLHDLADFGDVKVK